MNRAEAEEYLRTHKQAVMATIRGDGRPQLTNVLAVYDEGKLLVSLTESRAKYHNLVRDPRTTLLLLGDNFWTFLSVDGVATLIRMPDAAPLLRHYYELASGGPHEDWAEYDAAMRNDRRLVASVSIDHLYPLSE